MTGEAEQIARVGARIRQERVSRGLSINTVSERAGLTKGFISQLERGQASASLGSLLRIAGALDMELVQLFQQKTASSRLIHKADRPAAYVGGQGLSDSFLTPPTERRLQVIEAMIEPQGTAGGELWTADCDVIVAYVLQGALEMQFQDEPVQMEVGDSLTYSPRDPHTWKNPSDTESAIVVFFTVPAVF